MPAYKYCGYCRESHLVMAFYKNPRSIDGLRPYCKEYDKRASIKSRKLAVEAFDIMMAQEVFTAIDVRSRLSELFPKLVQLNDVCPGNGIRGLATAHTHVSAPFQGHICMNPNFAKSQPFFYESGMPSEILCHEYAHLMASIFSKHDARWKKEFKIQLVRFSYPIPDRINRFTSCWAT